MKVVGKSWKCLNMLKTWRSRNTSENVQKEQSYPHVRKSCGNLKQRWTLLGCLWFVRPCGGMYRVFVGEMFANCSGRKIYASTACLNCCKWKLYWINVFQLQNLCFTHAHFENYSLLFPRELGSMNFTWDNIRTEFSLHTSRSSLNLQRSSHQLINPRV